MAAPIQIIHETAPATWPQVVTASLAGAAFTLSCVALAIQRSTWRRAGFRPEVQWNYSHGPDGNYWVLTVRNKGRLAGSIDDIWFLPVMRSKWTRIQDRLMRRSDTLRVRPSSPIEGPMPHRLEPNASQSYRVHMTALGQLRTPYTNSFRPEIKFGDGSRVLAEPIEVAGKRWGQVSPEYHGAKNE